MKRSMITYVIIAAVLIYVSGMMAGTAQAQQAAVPAAQQVQGQTSRVQDNAAVPQSVEQSGEQQNVEEPRDTNGSLYHTVKRGGPLMIFIILLGMLALTIIIERLIFFTRNKVWRSDQVELYLKEVSEKSETRFKEDREDELRGAFQLYANNLERGMAFLSGIGNLAPIVGFLGTVLGMITAFSAIAAATTVNARVVAVGIQIALITTAGGLVVAAPTLFFYYLFTHVTQNRFALSEEIIAELCGNLPRLSEELETEEYAEEL
ncbi:MAG TPA: MotA/TolQ/ExbB proton channel family protein [Spirochaetota bacterium]|nr:MotA/TolQ/ExbB proton channel family protein [Spirochaetota bacterium]HQO03262.1 MotA/TolQ/ExbB proton channel family protein [Spirochaetota bacterium]